MLHYICPVFEQQSYDMKKQEGILRYSLIINKLRKQAADYEEIADYLELESNIQACDLHISKRTFQRDLNEIRNIYNIDIQFNRSIKKYTIVTDGNDENSTRVLEAFDVFNALNIADRLSSHIHFEKRRPQGTEYLQALLSARSNTKKISFVYQSYWDSGFTSRTVEPYALKEFKNRWYLLANDKKDNKIKSFALDRLTGLTVLDENFIMPDNFTVNDHYKYCFGIISPNADEPEDVLLSFDPLDGKYIKSLPLHESQKIEVDSPKELIVSLKLYLTYDFIMEILSHGDKVKVLQPESLRMKIKQILSNALKLY